MLNVLTAEFSWRSFGLDHPEPERFLVSRWQERSTPSRWYLVHRWFWALYHASWCAACFLCEGGFESPLDRKIYYFIYLTQWSYIVLTIMNVLWAVLVTMANTSIKAEGDLVKGMSGRLKLLWVLVNLSFLPAVLITCVYWLVVYDPAYPVSATNVETHIINSIYVFTELLVSALPIRILHFYQPMFYLVVYLVFNVIYYLLEGLTPGGHHAIYPILDWKRPSVTLPFIAFTLFLTLLVQSFVWVVSVVAGQTASRLRCSRQRPVLPPGEPRSPNSVQPPEDAVLHV